jgi:hypothetical protein
MNIGILKRDFRVTASILLHELLEVFTWSFHACIAGDRRLSLYLLSFTTSNWGCLAIFPTKRPSTAVARCGLADRFIYGSCMILLSHISFSQFGNSEQLVSGSSDRTRLNNSVAWSFPRFKFLTFSSLGTSEVYWLCHRSHWLSILATTNTEWMSSDSCDTLNVSLRQAISVQTCNVLRWDSGWTFLSILCNHQEAVTRKPRFRRPCSYNVFYIL